MPREVAVIDASQLGLRIPDHSHPLWWGFLGMIAIETTVFASLVTSYFYLQMGAPSWPPQPHPDPELLLPTINTLVLLASSGTMMLADRNAKRGDVRQLALWLIAGIVLAFIFLAMKAYEYGVEVGYRWDEHAYGSIVWTIIGFHTAHVLALVLKTIVVAILAWKRHFTQERRLAVVVNGLYWHFVVIIWIPLYIVLYWAPRAL